MLQSGRPFEIDSNQIKTFQNNQHCKNLGDSFKHIQNIQIKQTVYLDV